MMNYNEYLSKTKVANSSSTVPLCVIKLFQWLDFKFLSESYILDLFSSVQSLSYVQLFATL